MASLTWKPIITKTEHQCPACLRMIPPGTDCRINEAFDPHTRLTDRRHVCEQCEHFLPRKHCAPRTKAKQLSML